VNRCLPATFIAALADLQGRFIQLSLEYPVSNLPGGTLPVGRLVAVQSDYVALDRVIVGGVRLREADIYLVRLGNVFVAAPARVEEQLVDLALTVRAGAPRDGGTSEGR
jgi:hypothetical protein